MNIIIIGATSGIGLALAKEYSNNTSNQITITGRNQEKLNSLTDEFPHFETHCFDASVETEIEVFFTSLEKPFDLIINSAGWGEENEPYEWQIEKNMIGLNVFGFAKIANSAIKLFEKQGFGHFVNISSIGGLVPDGGANAYNSTKAFQISYTKGLFKLFKDSSIDITDIRPGFVDTKMAKGEGLFWVADVDKAAKQITKAILKKKKVAYVTKRWGLIGFVAKHFLS